MIFDPVCFIKIQFFWNFFLYQSDGFVKHAVSKCQFYKDWVVRVWQAKCFVSSFTLCLFYRKTIKAIELRYIFFQILKNMKGGLLFWPKVNANLFKDIVWYEAEKLLRNLSATMYRFSKNEAKPKIYQKLMTLISMQVQFPQIIVFSTS